MTNKNRLLLEHDPKLDKPLRTIFTELKVVGLVACGVAFSALFIARMDSAGLIMVMDDAELKAPVDNGGAAQGIKIQQTTPQAPAPSQQQNAPSDDAPSDAAASEVITRRDDEVAEEKGEKTPTPPKP